jgi:hypothetical protein
LTTVWQENQRKDAAKIELTELIAQATALQSKQKPVTKHLICKMGHAARRAGLSDDVFAKKMSDELGIDAQRLAEVNVPVPGAVKAAQNKVGTRQLASVR